MARVVLALLGAALVLGVSFFLTLKAIDHFGLLPSSVGPRVSLTVNGQDALVVPEGTPYSLTYSTSGAQSCEVVYRNSEDGSSGRFPVPPNRSSTNSSGLIGEYTLTCIGPDGASASKRVRITRAPK